MRRLLLLIAGRNKCHWRLAKMIMLMIFVCCRAKLALCGQVNLFSLLLSFSGTQTLALALTRGRDATFTL